MDFCDYGWSSLDILENLSEEKLSRFQIKTDRSAINKEYFFLQIWVFSFFLRIIKRYLHYKTITSENVPSKAQIKNFLFRRKIMFRSQDIQVFVFLTIL